MAQNIFTFENIYPYRYGTSSNYNGEWVQRNGVWAMVMAPSRFYNGSYSHILANEFVPNTQYLFHIYVDTDDHYHNDKYTSAGIYIRYTDDTRDGAIYCGQSTTPRGWQLKRYITPADKSVQNIEIGYNYGDPSYYRWDSYIVPIDTEKIAKLGWTSAAQFAEGEASCVFTKGGGIEGSQMVEF